MDSGFDRLQAALPQRYTLLEELDRGGASSVYRAREELPDRDVVIKVLGEELSERVGEQGFARLVELSSKLVHPHIVPIYSAGNAGGSLYYVMPYVSGESLRDRLDRVGSLPVPDALRFTRQIARALQHAHAAEIVHRDVKPANILLQSDHALIADFGVAHALGRGERSGSRASPSIGTTVYLSPEQLDGSTRIDGRSDTFSLACVVHEMLGGRPPRRAVDEEGRVVRAEVDDAIPFELAGVLERALDIDPRNRPASVTELAQALTVATSPTPSLPLARDPAPPARSAGRNRWVRWGLQTAAVVMVLAGGVALYRALGSGSMESLVAGGPWQASIAVMPFENRTADPELDNLGQSLADEIINHLTTVPEVRVIDTYTAASLLKDSLGTPRLLDTLNVEHVIHGFIEAHEGALVVNVSESDRGGFLSRRAQHSLTPGNLNEEQAALAQEVALSFLGRVGLAQDVGGPATYGPGRDAYLAGNTLLGQRTPEAMADAIAMFAEAITLEPGYAPAQAGLSSAYALALYYKYDVGLPAYELAARSLTAADSAIALDPDLANGYSARGYARALLGIEIDEAEEDFARAEELAPNAPNGPSWSARILAERGLVEEAFREAERARDLDPLQAGRRTALASLGFQVGNYEVVIEEARRAYRLEDELLLAKAFEGRALALTGRGVECLRIDFGVYDLVRALCLHSLGREAEARAMAEEAGVELEALGISDGRYLAEVVAQDLASYYGSIGDVTGATRWLRYAFDRSPAGVDARILYSALFDPVREDPTFATAVEGAKREAITRVRTLRADLARVR